MNEKKIEKGQKEGFSKMLFKQYQVCHLINADQTKSLLPSVEDVEKLLLQQVCPDDFKIPLLKHIRRIMLNAPIDTSEWEERDDSGKLLYLSMQHVSNQPESQYWLYTPPDSHRTTLNSEAFGYAMRSRYLQDFTRACGVCKTSINLPNHCSSCPRISKTSRHEAIKLVLVKWLKALNVHSELKVEDRIGPEDHRYRSDIKVVVRNKIFIIDVMVVNHVGKKVLDLIEPYSLDKLINIGDIQYSNLNVSLGYGVKSKTEKYAQFISDLVERYPSYEVVFVPFVL